MSRCVNRVLGLGCGRDAEAGSRLCGHCSKMVFGPVWKDPVPWPVLAAVVLLVILAISCAIASAQEARVLTLNSGDACDAKAAWTNLQDAQKRWEEVQEHVRKKYLQVHYGDPEAGSEIVGLTSGTGTLLFSGHATFTNYTPTNEEVVAMAERERQRERLATYGRKGWEGGFQFTNDFKFIVPKSGGNSTSNCVFQGGNAGVWCGSTILTPAVAN